MDLTTVTVADFKAQFPNDFPYLPVYDPAALYNMGDEVYYPTTLLFYSSLLDGVTAIAPNTVTNPPTWVKKVDSINNYIQDAAITRAFAEATLLCNQSLFDTDAGITLGYLYLTAHYLANDTKAAMAGINSSGGFPVTSRSVGSVSESYGVPQAYLENPIYAMYTQSSYGMKYLAMILSKLAGNVVAVYGGSQP